MTAPVSPALPGQLCIRLSETRLCLARYDAGGGSSFRYSSFHLNPKVSLTANLREAGRTEELLKEPAEGSVRVMVCAPATYVPLAEFQEEDCEAVYNLCFPENEQRRVFYDVAASANCVVLFSLQEQTCHSLEEAFGHVYYMSSVTPLLRHFVEKGLGRSQKRFFVNAHGGVADVFVFEDTRLLLANTYRVRTAVDVAYYVFGIARQLGAGIAPSEEVPAAAGTDSYAPFYVMGRPGLLREICAELRKYAKNVRPVNPGAEFNRHVVAVTPGVPYDLVVSLLDQR